MSSLVFTGEAGLSAPPGAENLSILIAGVNVEGTLPGLQDETAELERRLTRGRIAVSEVFEQVTELERAYIEQGFILARVVVPQQRLVDGGTLRIVVVDGFVESIDSRAVPGQVRGRLEQMTSPLIGRRGLQRSEIERRLLLAGDTYGIALGSALATGATPGGTVIILEPKFREITGFVGLDNAQSDALGNWNLDLGLEVNGALGLGEAFYLRASGYPGSVGNDESVFSDQARRRTLALGAVFPISANGLSLNAEVAQSINRPEVTGPGTQSEFDRASLRLYYPLVRSRDRNITSQLTLDIQEDQLDLDTEVGPLPLYHDKLSVLRATASGAWIRADESVIQTDAILSFGLDAFGARTAEDAAGTGVPLSRAGADAVFRKLELAARYRKSFGEGFDFALNGRGQTSFGDPLLVSEQFGIANTSELSAFPTGTINGDTGWVARGEVGRLFNLNLSEQPVTFRPYLFAATGQVFREQPQIGEANQVRADSYGLGGETFFRRDPAFSNASLRLEFVRGGRSDGGNDGKRVLLLGSIRF